MNEQAEELANGFIDYLFNQITGFDIKIECKSTNINDPVECIKNRLKEDYAAFAKEIEEKIEKS